MRVRINSSQGTFPVLSVLLTAEEVAESRFETIQQARGIDREIPRYPI